MDFIKKQRVFCYLAALTGSEAGDTPFLLLEAIRVPMIIPHPRPAVKATVSWTPLEDQSNIVEYGEKRRDYCLVF